MKFGRAYSIYVQQEVPRIMPNVEFKKFKKLLKNCPHLMARPNATDADSENEDETSCDCTTLTSTPAPAAPSHGVVISEYDDQSRGYSVTDVVGRQSSNLGNTATEKTNVSCPACDAQFFPDLDKSVSEVVSCFKSRAQNLLRQHMATGLQKYFIWLKEKLAGDKVDIAQVGTFLVSYGCMNSLAVRKILKKYDKVHGSENGKAYKSRLQLRRMELLQSPLLIELGALAVNLMNSKVPSIVPSQSQVQAPGHYVCSFDDEKQTITFTFPEGLRLDFDLTCSICLEVVFDPIALSCGHIFCNSCVCTAAAVSMFDGVTVARRSKKCPICRQTGVYGDAVEMGELHILVSERCSSYYNERLPIERQKRLLDAKLHWESQTEKFLRM
ncbi:unnamed protein product [Calypogeia fissa]